MYGFRSRKPYMQTRQDEQRTTRRGPGEREVQRKGKRRRGRGKGAAARARAGETAGVAHAEKDDNALGRRNVPRKPAQQDTEEKDQRLVPAQDVPYALIL